MAVGAHEPKLYETHGYATYHPVL